MRKVVSQRVTESEESGMTPQFLAEKLEAAEKDQDFTSGGCIGFEKKGRERGGHKEFTQQQPGRPSACRRRRNVRGPPSTEELTSSENAEKESDVRVATGVWQVQPGV